MTAFWSDILKGKRIHKYVKSRLIDATVKVSFKIESYGVTNSLENSADRASLTPWELVKMRIWSSIEPITKCVRKK